MEVIEGAARVFDKNGVSSPGLDTVEIAVPLTAFGLTNFSIGDIEWAYLGAAESNPSNFLGEIFANDAYTKDLGSGLHNVEYDTIRFDFSNPVPEPSSLILFATTAACLVGFGWRRKKRTAK